MRNSYWLAGFCFNTETQGAGGAGNSLAPPPSQPVQSPPSSTSPVSAPGSGSPAPQPSPAPASIASSVAQGLGSPPSTPSAGDFLGIREALQQQFGLNLQGVDNDQAALAQLAQAYQIAQQHQQVAPYLQQYLQHAEQFNAWRTQQEQAAQAQQQAQAQWWKAPEYDPSWEAKIVRDPVTGALRTIDGANPEIIAKYQRAREHQATFLQKFALNPIDAIKPGIEEIVRSQAQALVQQEVRRFQDQLTAQQLVAQHTSWLHAQDQNGRPVVDQQGQRQLTPLGQRYAAYAQQATQMGIPTLGQIHDYALGMVQRDVLAQQHQAQLAAQQGQQQANALVNGQVPLTGGTPQTPPNQLAALTGNNPPVPGTPGVAPQPGVPLRERMRRTMKQAGITDAMIGQR